MSLKFEIIIGNKATIEATLLTYMSSKKSHTLKVLGFDYDGTNYHCLVRYEE